MKIKLLLILSFITLFCGYAQNHDSITKILKHNIKSTTLDSVKIALQIELADHIMNSNIDSASRILNNVSTYLETKKSSPYYLKQKANLLNTYGNRSFIQGVYYKASLDYLEAIKIKEQIKDSTHLAKSYTRLGKAYSFQQNLDKDVFYYKKALLISDLINNKEDFSQALIGLGLHYLLKNEKDSSLYYYEKAKNITRSPTTLQSIEASITTLNFNELNLIKAYEVYEKSIKLNKELKNNYLLGKYYYNLGAIKDLFGEHTEALNLIDTAIIYSNKINNIYLLNHQYKCKANINVCIGNHQQALSAYIIHQKYSDSLNDISTIKNLAQKEIEAKFEKEKNIINTKLNKETSKGKLYFILLITATFVALIISCIIWKNNKQKIKLTEKKLEQEQVDKFKTQLALANKENEFKKIVVEGSVREETLNKILTDVKGILTLQNEGERQASLRTLFASLSLEKVNQKTWSNLQTYLSKVNSDFKLLLDTHFPELKPKEKELLYLMKIDLSTNEICKIINSTQAAIKSSRYRIRKKLGLNSDQDIIAYIDAKVLNEYPHK